MLMAKTWEETEKSFRQENNVMKFAEFSLSVNKLTLSPLSDLMSIIVSTVSYRIAFPTFLLVSVFVATCKHSHVRITIIHELWSESKTEMEF